MNLLKTKPIVIRVKEGNPFFVPDLVEVTNGPIPDRLRPYSEVFTGPVRYKVKELDAQQFEADERAREAREQTPPVAAPKVLTVDQILKQFFGGNPELLATAERLGFPKATGRLISSHRLSATYLEKDIIRWRNDFVTIARAMRLHDK